METGRVLHSSWRPQLDAWQRRDSGLREVGFLSPLPLRSIWSWTDWVTHSQGLCTAGLQLLRGGCSSRWKAKSCVRGCRVGQHYWVERVWRPWCQLAVVNLTV